MTITELQRVLETQARALGGDATVLLTQDGSNYYHIKVGFSHVKHDDGQQEHRLLLLSTGEPAPRKPLPRSSFTGGLLAVLLLCLTLPLWAGETFVEASYGQRTLQLSSDLVTALQGSSPASQILLGQPLGHGWALTGTYADLGTYRATLAKEVRLWRQFSIDVPGYAEIHGYGYGLGMRYQTDLGPYAALTALRYTVTGNLHTPIGYRLYEDTGWTPVVDVGFRRGPFVLTYSYVPKLPGVFLGAHWQF